jgi:arylsulfatase A-like enzyme
MINRVLPVWISPVGARRSGGVAALSFMSVVLLSASCFISPDVLVAQTTPPLRLNIVVIMTDDQTLESLRVMQKTRSLIGAAGTTFSRNYASFPLCCPSRATYLTGQYPHNHGVFSNVPPSGGYTKLNHTNTLPVWLRESGYFTSHIGKYMNGYGEQAPTEVPPGWSHWQGLVGRSVARMYNYTINDRGVLRTYGEAPADYQTDVIATRAVNTITEAIPKQPFFLSIAPLAPHFESSAPIPKPKYPRPAPRHVGAFDTEPLPRPPSFNEANVSDKPAFVRNLSLMTASDIGTITAGYRRELASLLAVDDLVGRVVSKLSATGILNNTMLIFTSDNGFFHGEHRIRMAKVRVYEPSSHIPLIVRGPGFPAGATIEQVVSNVDLATTIVDLADATPRRVMDGQSLLTLAQNPSAGDSRGILIETMGYKAVRNKSFLYVEHGNGERELYDMQPESANYDPFQTRSRHADPAYDAVESQLATKLDMLKTCVGASCR